MFSMFVICSALLLLSIKYSNEHKTKPPVVILANICYSSLMKKYVVTSLITVGVASIAGLAIGMAINRPILLNSKAASATQATPAIATATTTTDTPAQTPTQLTTQATQPTVTATQPTTTTVKTGVQTSVTTTDPVVTVTAYEQIPTDALGDIDCKLSYSDATTYQWHWQTIDPNGSWVTDGSGQNGHWVAATETYGPYGKCDRSLIGMLEANWPSTPN
jgi:hypothetical protein